MWLSYHQMLLYRLLFLFSTVSEHILSHTQLPSIATNLELWHGDKETQLTQQINSVMLVMVEYGELG